MPKIKKRKKATTQRGSKLMNKEKNKPRNQKRNDKENIQLIPIYN